MRCGKKIAALDAQALEALIDSQETFVLRKDDISTTVGTIRGALFHRSGDVWLKRFNSKGAADFLAKRIFGSRARRLWTISKRLYEAGLPVPLPLAFCEPSCSMRHSFYLSAAVESAEDLGSLFLQGRFDASRERAEQLGRVLAAWHSAGAVHGDLKWSNILLQKDGERRSFFFVDLDQAQLYSRPNLKGIVKDLVRFYRYGLELGAEAWVEAEFFPAYLAELPDAVRPKVDLPSIKSTAIKIWRRKGSRRLAADR